MTDQLLFVESPATGHTAVTDELQLLTLNVQHANAERGRRQAEWLARQEMADVLVLTEVGYRASSEALMTGLAQRGYGSVLVIPSVSGSPDLRTVLASRSASLEALCFSVGLPHRAPAAEVRIGNHVVALLGLYVPSRADLLKKRSFQDDVASAVPVLVDGFSGPVIVSGDLNVLEPDHTPRHTAFRTWEYSFYSSFLKAGLVDAFRHLHPDDVEHSWFSPRGNGYRYDHTFVTADHADRIRLCQYVHEPRELGLTDHSAMLLRLGL